MRLAPAKRRLADEYDAAQDRGEIKANGGDRTVPLPNSEDIGVSRKDIHDARIVRDAEQADPGVTRRALDLTKEQRDEHIRRYAELLEARRVEVSRQNDAKPVSGPKGGRPEGVASQVAKETGLSVRTVQRALNPPPVQPKPVRSDQDVILAQANAIVAARFNRVKMSRLKASPRSFRHRHPDAARLAREVRASFDQRSAHGIYGLSGNRLAQLKPGARHAANGSLGGQIMQRPLKRGAGHS